MLHAITLIFESLKLKGPLELIKEGLDPDSELHKAIEASTVAERDFAAIFVSAGIAVKGGIKLDSVIKDEMKRDIDALIKDGGLESVVSLYNNVSPEDSFFPPNKEWNDQATAMLLYDFERYAEKLS